MKIKALYFQYLSEIDRESMFDINKIKKINS